MDLLQQLASSLIRGYRKLLEQARLNKKQWSNGELAKLEYYCSSTIDNSMSLVAEFMHTAILYYKILLLAANLLRSKLQKNNESLKLH